MKSIVSVERITVLFKCLIASYLVTGILLIVIAGMLYKFSLSENMVEIGIIITYCVSSLLAGIFYSKGAENRRFAWGTLAGVAYFLIICSISAAVETDFELLSNSVITTFFICTGSGMIGGMIS